MWSISERARKLFTRSEPVLPAELVIRNWDTASGHIRGFAFGPSGDATTYYGAPGSRMEIRHKPED